MSREHITSSSAQTKKLGRLLAKELCGGEIICLSGDLGAGKTTFSQGLLQGLGIKGPYTSPTFGIMKHYHVTQSVKRRAQDSKTLRVPHSTFHEIFHIDAYRIGTKDLLELGFKDFAGEKNSITIIEWPERVRKLIPIDAVWINFKWLCEGQRKISFKK